MSQALRLTMLRLRKSASLREQSMSDPQLPRVRRCCSYCYNRSDPHSTIFPLHNATRPRCPIGRRTISSHQSQPHVKHTAIYLWLVTHVSKTVWSVPQRVCTALSSPDLLTLIFAIEYRIVLTKTVLHAHIVCYADVSSAAMVRHAACRISCYVVAWLKGRVEKGGAVAAVTVAGRAGDLRYGEKEIEKHHEM
jgi:hypothetical protein